MFLIDRPSVSPALRADLVPRPLFGSTGDLIRAALVARPPADGPVAPAARHPAAQCGLARPAPARQRKVG